MSKKWYASLTVWAVILTAVLGAAEQSIAAIGGDTAAKVLPIISAAVAIIGRFRAQGPATL